MCMEHRRFSQQWLPNGKLLLLSLTKCHGVPCSLTSRITTKVLKNCKTFSSRPRPRPRLHDPRPRPRLSFLSSRRLETKTLVSRTTSSIVWIHRTVSYRIVSECSVHHYSVTIAAVAAAAALAGKSHRSGDTYCIDTLTHLYWLPLGRGCRSRALIGLARCECKSSSTVAELVFSGCIWLLMSLPQLTKRWVQTSVPLAVRII